MKLPKAIERGINEYFAENDCLNFEIRSTRPTGGGDINETALIDSNQGRFFVKWNSASRFPSMFDYEFEGLQILREAKEIALPEPLHSDEIDDYGFLLMEAIEMGTPAPNFWFKFGQQLAELHRHTHEQFGLDHNNYIGSLPQQNHFCATWEEFFVTQRMEPQLKHARDKGKMDAGDSKLFSAFFARIDQLFPKENPSLLHGDLWSGNFMINQGGEAVLIDPAIYYGHREMDLGMTQLFGGFQEDFYQGYHQQYPLESGWQQRINYANLYPLMVHVNLFGGGYVQQVKQILKGF